MGCRVYIRTIEENRSPEERLHQSPGFADVKREVLPWVGVLRNVDDQQCVLSLEEVQNPHQILEKGEAWIICSQLSACATDALALPAASQ